MGKIIVIIILLFSFSCKDKEQKPVYMCGTPEFETKSKELKYNLSDAIDIYCKYLFEETQKDSLKFYIRIIYNNDYIFSTIPFEPKSNKCSLNGYWVNGKTGEIKKENSDSYVKIKPTPFPLGLVITREQFKKNGGSAFTQKIDTQ